MNIDVYSDFVCPFCYIGKKRLEEALDQTSLKDSTEVTFKSFELDPNSPRGIDLSIHEVIAKKYSISIEQAKKSNEGIGKQAASVGLDFRFDDMIPTNTFDAHRLEKYSSTKGKEKECTERLLKAYFTEGRHIGDHETLLDIAEQVGLDPKEAKAVLEHGDYQEDVRKDESLAHQIGVQGVPFFVINNKYAISGAQPTEVFIEALNKVAAEEKETTTLKPLTSENADGMVCDDNGCEIPQYKK
ncbi:DsbA family oxidoreductase [Chengkuizengella axinellae]|uniref:DsbA family oxidoreductase n=1 Tax=Chengkuizengella axinellae TaxID=3064388 RepID=A0ABT9J476_9BACL|nr:DsbA family oxidoreductase [Chengkuizengella sp. 2205SS18-9]MDP5276446.1 DsbA family oxidoreductase [Chengkuizengella sp. 2205SS18-9]